MVVLWSSTLYPGSLFIFDGTWLDFAQVCSEAASSQPFSPKAGSAWSFCRCKLWLMSFWLESRKRHFHYGLSKYILLVAVKSISVCEYACLSCECSKERTAFLDDETHLMTFLIWVGPKRWLHRPWGAGGPDHFRKWGTWWQSPDQIFLPLTHTETWAAVSPLACFE